MDSFVRLIKLPLSVKGVTIPDKDGNYNIFINKNLSYEIQVDTYIHEINHIENTDFYKNCPVQVLENKAKYGICK